MNYGTIIEFLKLEPLKRPYQSILKFLLDVTVTFTVVACDIQNSRKYK